MQYKDNSTVLSRNCGLLLITGKKCSCFTTQNELIKSGCTCWLQTIITAQDLPSLTVLCCALDTRKKDATHILRGKLRPITDLSETFDQLRSTNNDFLTSWKCLPRDWAWTRSQVRKEQLAGRRWSVNDNLAADEASYRFETLDNGQSYRFVTAGNKCSVDNELQELLGDTLDQIDDASICTRSKWCQTEAGPLPHISSQWLLHLSRPTHPPKPNTPQTYWWWDDGPVKIIQNTFFLILNMFDCLMHFIPWTRVQTEMIYKGLKLQKWWTRKTEWEVTEIQPSVEDVSCHYLYLWPTNHNHKLYLPRSKIQPCQHYWKIFFLLRGSKPPHVLRVTCFVLFLISSPNHGVLWQLLAHLRDSLSIICHHQSAVVQRRTGQIQSQQQIKILYLVFTM